MDRSISSSQISFNSLKAKWFLVKQLTAVSIKKEFKRSFIGLIWLLLAPLLSVVVWIILHSAGVISPGDTAIAYPAYVLISTSIWGFFINAYLHVSNIILQSGHILLSNAIPIEVLVLKTILVHCIHFLIPLAINILVLLLFGVQLQWLGLLFPLAIIPLLLLGTGLGLLTALLRLVAVDVAWIIDQGLKFLMFLTPIIYSPKISNVWLSSFVDKNPLTYLIGLPRDLLIKSNFIDPKFFFLNVFISVLVFALAYRVFITTYKKILERFLNN